MDTSVTMPWRARRSSRPRDRARRAAAARATVAATVGTLALEPGALSVIPSRVRLGVDVRAIDEGSLDRVDGGSGPATGENARRRGAESRPASGAPRAGKPTELRSRARASCTRRRRVSRHSGDETPGRRRPRLPALGGGHTDAADVRAAAGRREPHAARGCRSGERRRNCRRIAREVLKTARQGFGVRRPRTDELGSQRGLFL